MKTPSRLQSDLARRILARLHAEQAQPGHRLVEEDLCRSFGVSRTPVRGALRLLAEQGAIAPREGRGFVLKSPPAPVAEPPRADATDALFQALAKARQDGTLPAQFSQQEIVRRFDVPLPLALKVLQQLAELGILERKPGNGWAFIPDTARALNESYAFRRAVEPAMLLVPGFKLDRAWAEKSRAEHLALRRRPEDAAAFHEVNADFHEQLARCSGNRTMHRAIQGQLQLRRFLSHQWDYPADQVHAAIDDHLEILSALDAGYADKAAALMLHHLTQSASQSPRSDA